MIDYKATIDQATIQEYLQQSGYHTSPSTNSRTLEREGYSYKKVKKVAIERSPSSRADFVVRIADYGVEQLVWIDESFKDDRTCIKSHGYSRRDQDAVVAAVHAR